MEIIRDNVKIEWEAIGEGYSGDYNPKDPEDVELLRFYVSVLRDGVWEEKEDGSYCTLFPANATDEEQMQGLQLLMDNFHPVLFDDPGAPIKKLGEHMSWIGLHNIPNVSSGMSLRQFLDTFDFDYDIVSPGDGYENSIRQSLLAEGELAPEYLGKDLICLIDKQGAYFGDIDKERYPIEPASAEKIVERMDVYIQDTVIDAFEEALQGRDIDTSHMSLGDMVEKCKELNVGTGEVSYWLAGVVIDPSKITIPEVQLQKQFESEIADSGSLEDKIKQATAVVAEASVPERVADVGRDR